MKFPLLIEDPHTHPTYTHTHKYTTIKNLESCVSVALVLPRRPASCSWIFSISIGVVTMTWHIPAQQPASISLKTVNLELMVQKKGKKKQTKKKEFASISWFCLKFILLLLLLLEFLARLVSSVVDC